MKRFPNSSKIGLACLLLLLRVGLMNGNGQDWLNNAQKKPTFGQAKIFYNPCANGYVVISGNTKKWSQSAVRIGESVTLQLIGVNPFYKQTIKFDKASFSYKTPEPENFKLTTVPTDAGAEKNKPGAEEPTVDKKDLNITESSNNVKTQKVTGARGLVKNQINALELKNKAKKKPSVSTENYIAFLEQLLLEADRVEAEIAGSYRAVVASERQAFDAINVLESIVSFQNSLTISPCLTLDEYSRQETALLTSITDHFKDANVVNNAGTLTNAFRHSIEAYPLTYDFAERKRDQLQKDIDNLRAQIESIATKESKTAAQALVDAIESDLKSFSISLDNKQSAVDTLTSQLAGDEGQKITRTCQTLLNNKTFFTIPFVLGPFSPDRNANEISVTATAKRPAADGRGESTEDVLIDLKLPIVNNIQIDFTTGGLFSSLADEAFVVKTTPSSTTATADSYAIQTNKNRGGFVLATQANLIWQKSPSFGWGANIGIGVDVVNNQSARYIMGLSSKFGGLSDNLLVSAGVVLGKVKRLSAELSPDTSYQQQVDPKTYDKFETGFYAGISYVLGSKKINK